MGGGGWTWWALGNRPVLFPFGFVLAGVAAAPFVEVDAWLTGLTAFVLCVAALGWAPRPGAGLSILLSCAALGFTAATLGLGVDVPAAGPAVIEGEVEGWQSHPSGQSVRLAATWLDGAPARFRVALSSEGGRPLLPGQRVRVAARLKPVLGRANPGEWNRAAWALRHGQPVTGGFDARRLVVLSAPSRWQAWLDEAHGTLKARARSMTDDSEAAALFLTLAAGERAELGDDLEDAFSRSGLAHVLSVSGLHVAVLAFTAFAGLRWLLSRRMTSRTRRTDPRAWAGPLSVPLVWAYVAFTGMQAPAVRSAVMCTLLLSAHALRRRSDPLNALAAAGLVMTLVDPAAPFDLSVQLSFVAVLALIILAPLVRAAVPVAPPSPARERGWGLRLSRWREAVVQTFTASIAVTLATAPLVLGAFQRVSLAGLLSNVVTLPLSGLVTILAASAAGLHVLAAPLATPVLWAGLQASKLFVWIAHAFAAMPGSSVGLPAPESWVVALWWSGLVALVFLRGRWRALALAAPVAAALHLLVPAWAPPSTVDVTFLSVGHGDAIVVSSRGQHAVIDGGGVPNGQDTGRRFLLPFLRQRRVTRLALAALSHAHPDHALGLASTLDEVQVDRLWLPADVGRGPLVQPLIDAAGVATVEEVEAGDGPLVLGDATLDVLAPPRDRSTLENENDRSMVLRLRHGDVSFLLTGDVEAAAEAMLDAGPVTVLKAPHHGSDTSSSPRFVAKVRPRHVVFCVGRNNRFDFPRADVVARYEAAGARCYRTDLDGAITFHSDGRDVTVETFGRPALPQARRR
jgi:competence protein ComEC